MHHALKIHELWNLESLTTSLTMPGVMTLSEIQSWVFNIKTQCGLGWLLLWIQTCFLFDIQGVGYLWCKFTRGLQHGSCAPGQSLGLLLFLLFLKTKPSMWKLNYREMIIFRPERAECEYGWLVRDWRGCNHQSLCSLIRAEHPETASNDRGIGIKSQRYLESNWSG